MTTAPDLHISRWGDAGERLLLIHGGNTADPDALWEEQRVFAARHQLVIPHRRGYGRSPLREPDWTYQEDVVDLLPLLGDGAHVVGLSYGGLLSLLLAGQRPDLIRSLTVIEPPVFSLAIDDPQVARLIAALTPVYAASPTPEVFIAGFVQALGEQLPPTFQLSPQHRKSVEATMREPAPWTIPLPLDLLARLNFPKLVVSGDWHPAFIVTADRLAQRIAAQRLLIANTGHGAQGSGHPFNERLLALMQPTS
jgi:pimeloyl-ACP methyl ester carboxylesterase